MYRCPKCHSTRVGGPRFITTLYRECLRYVCLRCGYYQDEATMDEKKGVWRHVLTGSN